MFLTIIATLVSGLLAFFIYKSTTRPPNFPPGPRGIPFLGSAHRLTRSPHVGMLQLSKKYGKVFSIKMGQKNIVCVVGFEANREVLVDRAKELCDRRHVYIFTKTKGVEPSGIIYNVCGPSLTAHRKLFHTAVREIGIGQQGIERLVQNEKLFLMEAFATLAQGGKATMVTSLFRNTVMNVVSSFVFGKRYHSSDEKMSQLLEMNRSLFATAELYSDKLFLLPQMIPGLDKIWLPKSARKFVANTKKIIDFCAKEVKSHEEELDPNFPKDFNDRYLAKIKKETGHEKRIFTQHNLLITLLDLFMAGNETTANALEFAVLYLAKHDEVQKSIHEEIEKVVGPDGNVTYNDRINMPYTEATTHEVLRFANISPVGGTRISIADTTLRGYTIPKGTSVMVNPYSSHFQEDKWKNAMNFDPENFLNEDGKFTNNEAFMAFGGGLRLCVGIPIAKQELFIFLVSILQKYQIKPETDDTELDLEPTTGITQAPKSQKYRFISRE